MDSRCEKWISKRRMIAHGTLVQWIEMKWTYGLKFFLKPNQIYVWHYGKWIISLHGKR